MNSPKTCGQCNSEIPKHAPFGMCPVCVLNLASSKKATQQTSSRPMSNAQLPEPHELTGKFPNLEIMSLLGHGGMGAVYLARQTTLDRIVALKVLSRSLADDPSFTERFAREAKTLAKLTHPNIVTVFDSGQSTDGSYLVMEYVDGVNLRDAIASQRIDAARALAIVQQICDALQHAHDAGVIHRDIKPENILVDRNGMVKIADFGLAKLLQPQKAEQYSLTGTRQVLGTRNYMAPEQIETPESVDHRADLYSLGVVLYELLTGELPIGRFAPPSSKSGCSQQLDDLVLRTLEKDPGQRFQQASMIGSAVRELESSIGTAASQAPLVESVTRAEPRLPKSNPNAVIADPVPFSMSNLKSQSQIAKSSNITIHTASAKGLLHAYEDRIELEYRVHDPMQSGESELKVCAVDLDDLASATFQPTWWGGARIRFRGMSMSAIQHVPKVSHGEMVINVSNRHRKAADEFSDAVNRRIAALHPNRSSVRKRTDEDQTVTIEEIVLLDERLKVPRLGFWICSIATLIAGLILVLCAGFVFSMPNRRFYDSMISMLGPEFPYIFILAPIFMFAWVMPLVAAKSIKHHRNYHLLIVLCVAMLMPWVSPLFVLQMPLALWTLIVLAMPNTRKVFRKAALDERLSGGKTQNRTRKNFATPAVVAALLCIFIAPVVLLGFSWISYRSTADNTPVPVNQSVYEDPRAKEILAQSDRMFENVEAERTPAAEAPAGEEAGIPQAIRPSSLPDRHVSNDARAHVGPSRLRLSWIAFMGIGFLVFAGLILGTILSVLTYRLVRKRK